jgi:hypothetical protein
MLTGEKLIKRTSKNKGADAVLTVEKKKYKLIGTENIVADFWAEYTYSPVVGSISVIVNGGVVEALPIKEKEKTNDKKQESDNVAI